MKANWMQRNYRRRFTVIVVAALLLAIVTAVGVPLSLRTQIQEAVALEQTAQAQGTARHEAEDAWKGQLTPVPAANIVFYGMLGALWAALLLFYWLEVVGWLYKSAAQAQMHPSLWPILGLFFNVFAVFAFWIVRDWPRRAAA